LNHYVLVRKKHDPAEVTVPPLVMFTPFWN